MRRSAAKSCSREPLGPFPSVGNWPFGARQAPVRASLPSGPARAMGPDPCGCTAGHADGRLPPGHGPATGWEGAPVTRRLLAVAAVAVMLGLVATPALDETAVGGWFDLPWDGSRGLGQPGQQGEPTASSPTMDRQGGKLSHRTSQTRPGGRPGHQRESCMRPRGQVAGKPQVGQGGKARSSRCRP
jgi:hypothetical protein